MYLYSAMTDLAAETGDATLWTACKRLWRNVTEERMYVTGAVGSAAQGERFTCDYDLPNEAAYAETCAAIGLVFWAHRMLQVERDGRYADVMERALYNAVLSGVSLDGTRFFYANPLALYPPALRFSPGVLSATRQEWYGCACCPPNIARLIASLREYMYSQGRDEVCVHLYAQGSAELEVTGRRLALAQETNYPWDGAVRLTLGLEEPARFALALRVPGWCRKARLKVNGRAAPLGRAAAKGYARVRRLWQDGDCVELELPMPVERITAHPKVRSDAGRVALQRGPIVYCLEEADNGPDLNDISLPRNAALRARYEQDTLGGVVAVTGHGRRSNLTAWRGSLYRPARTATKPVTIRAVPYCTWANRKPGEMLVWIREA
jgi:hypothetical protein